MVLGFNPRFVDPILAGSKIHTIRADAHDRWREGLTIQFATGVRTKKYRKFKEGLCIRTQTIIIEHHDHTIGDTEIVVDNKILSLKEIKELSANDGFENLVDFVKWFDKDCFKGKLIHWTQKRY